MAKHSSNKDLQQKYGDVTVLTINRILDPVAAIQEALAVYSRNS